MYLRKKGRADGSRLAWLSWRHPYIPWIATYLIVAEFDEGGGLGNKRTVAGGDTESLFQPQWSPDNVLYFVSDRTDFWNIYRWKEGSKTRPCPIQGRGVRGAAMEIWPFHVCLLIRSNYDLYFHYGRNVASRQIGSDFTDCFGLRERIFHRFRYPRFRNNGCGAFFHSNIGPRNKLTAVT